MNQPPPPSPAKNFIIFLLLLIVGIQGYLLWKAHEKPPQPVSLQDKGQTPPATGASPAAPASVKADAAPGSVEAASFNQKRDTVFISFTKPVGEEESSGELSKPPFDVDPPVPGSWTWMGPYILRFSPSVKNPFDFMRTYTFTARPERFLPAGMTLTGRSVFEIRGAGLSIYSARAELDPIPGKPGQYVITFHLRFNRMIDPKEALKGFTLIDPRLGEASPVPLTLAKDQQDADGEATLRLVSDPVTGESKPRTFTLLASRNAIATAEGVTMEQNFALSVPVVHSTTLSLGQPRKNDDSAPGWLFTFSAKTGPEEFKHALSFDPPVDGLSVSSEQGQDLLVSGSFLPGQKYVVTVAKGLKAANGAVLEKNASFVLHIPDATPSARFASPGVFLPKSGSRNLLVESVNTVSANIQIDRVFRNNIFFALNYYDASFLSEEAYSEGVLPYLGDSVAAFDLKLKSPRNQTLKTPCNIDEQVKDFEPGLYRLALSTGGEGGQGGLKWMLITDLGVAAKRGHDDLTVWVASYKDAQPVAGAKIKVISAKNQVLFQGVTGPNGIWRTTGLANLPEEKALFMVTVEKDADYSFLHFDRFRTDTTGLDVSGVQVAQAGYQAFLWGERDIYRPGETVQLALAVRDATLQTPPAMPVKLRWTDPQGRETAVENLRTDPQGMAFASRTIPAHMPTGPYTVEVLAGDETIGQYRFELEDFKPDRISTEIKPETDRAAPGSQLTYQVEGRYLFGAPAAGLAVETQVVLTPVPFAPKGYEAYVFGDPERAFEAVQLPRETTTLSEEGKAVFKAAIPEGLKPPAALAAMVSARVSEAGGRGVAARIKMLADAYPRYPGIKKPGESGLTPGKPQAFDYVVVDGLGQEAKATSLVAELYEDRWQSVLKRSEGGQGFKYESKRDARLVERREIADPGAKGQVSFTPPKYGSYRLVLREPATGASSQLSFWAEGQGYNPWAVENPAKLEMAAAKNDYLPGETAKIQVRAPFSGKLLVTVESTGVKDVLVADMPANTGEVNIPVKPGYGPNVYVTAVLVRKGTDVQPGQAGRAFGVMSLNVGREAGHQKVAVIAPNEIRPGAQLTVSAQADPGAVVTLAAVDEGILQLIAQKTADPWAAFYAKRALEVESFDTWAFLLPEVKALAKKAPAGGDDWSRYLRTESPQGDKSVAFWSGPLKADARGRVQWTITVPQFQGALRIMAVAVSGNRFGSAQAITRSRSPLALLPTFPRFAQTGETLKLPMTVRNDTGADGSFAVALEASGPAGVENASRTVDVPQNKERTVFFTVATAKTEGVARLTATVSGNGEHYQATTEFFVRSPLPAASRIEDGINDSGEISFKQDQTQGFIPGTVTRNLRLGRYPLVRFSGKLSDLLGYPHGCLEQTVSRSFPLLYFANVAKELEPAALAKSSPEAMVQQGINRALSLQQPSGGFGMWPGAEREQEWASVYATHFLVEASKAGYQAPARALEQALGYLAQDVKQLRNNPAGFKAQAYGLYVLALAGKPDRGMMDLLRDKQSADLPADAKALLAAAYALTGNAKGAEKLAANQAEPQAAARTEPIFDSPLRAKALQLAGLVDYDPASPETAEKARELSRMLAASGPISTQEAGMAFMALGKLFARQQTLAACSGQLMAGQTLVARIDTNKTMALKNLKSDGPLKVVLDPGCQPGSVFYTLDTRGIPELASYKASANGLSVERQFLSREGKPLDIAKLPQGTVVVVKTRVESTSGPLDNVVISQLMPSGLEVENPRLATTDKLPWMDEEPSAAAYSDYRADRVNVFVNLDGKKPAVLYTLCRAVIPGSYVLPPVTAEAMYAPELQASGALGSMTVEGGGE